VSAEALGSWREFPRRLPADSSSRMPDPDLIRFVEAQDAVRRLMVAPIAWRS
jgi:hypothetical protein